MVPISMDWPISTSSCFTIYSFARPISFFVAPFATEQISVWNLKVQGFSYVQQKIIPTKVLRNLNSTFYSARFVFLSTSNVKTCSQNCILISSSKRFLILYFLIYFIGPILKTPKVQITLKKKKEWSKSRGVSSYIKKGTKPLEGWKNH